MPAKDELARRRYEKLVDRLESLMRAALKPEYEGYYGQLVLSGDDLAEMGELKDVRRAALRDHGPETSSSPTSLKVSRSITATSTSTSTPCGPCSRSGPTCCDPAQQTVPCATGCP